jgi:hypothetical protein
MINNCPGLLLYGLQISKINGSDWAAIIFIEISGPSPVGILQNGPCLFRDKQSVTFISVTNFGLRLG